MIDIISKNGKKIGVISDSLDKDDYLIVGGEEIKLTDVYNSDDLREKFNKQLKAKKRNAKLES